MERFIINRTMFAELSARDIPLFKEFMQKEFPGYIEEGRFLLAHNEGDSGWFTQQFLDAKKGKGIYRDFFENRIINN